MPARSVALFLLLAMAPLGRTQPAAESAVDLLDAYTSRRFTVVDATISQVTNVGSVASELQKAAPQWVSADRSGERARTFVVSAVALELAGKYLDARDAQQILIPWAAELLARHPPDARERAWLLATNALLQRTYDPFFWPVFGGGAMKWDFPRHALARFPDEDRFHLARVIDLEMASWRAVMMRQRLGRMRAGIGGNPLPALAGALEKLLPRPSIAADVHLRLGQTYLRLDRFDAALKQFAQIETRTSDPFLIYLSRYFTGRARRATGDLPGAANAFRGALDLVPHAQSAALALASVTLAGENPADAYGLVNASVVRAATVDDPWRQYQEAEYRLWQSYVSALRHEVR